MEDQLDMLVVKPKGRDDGMYLLLAPENLDEAQMRAGFAELGLEPADVYQISGWQTSEVGLAAVFLPYFQSVGADGEGR